MTSPSRRAHFLVVTKSDREGGVIPRITALTKISLLLTGTRREVLEFFGDVQSCYLFSDHFKFRITDNLIERGHAYGFCWLRSYCYGSSIIYRSLDMATTILGSADHLPESISRSMISWIRILGPAHLTMPLCICVLDVFFFPGRVAWHCRWCILFSAWVSCQNCQGRDVNNHSSLWIGTNRYRGSYDSTLTDLVMIPY